MGRQLPTYCVHNIPIDGGDFTETKACFKCEMQAKEKQRKLAAYDEQVELIKKLVSDLRNAANLLNMHVLDRCCAESRDCLVCDVVGKSVDGMHETAVNAAAHLQNQKR